MKNIIFYLFVVLLSATLVVIFINHVPKRIRKIIFVETTYSYLAKENLEMDVFFYVNMKNDPLTDKNAYDYLYVSNLDDTKRIEVSIKGISSSHYETYLGEDYLKCRLTLVMPYLFGQFEIKDLYLSVYLENRDYYQFKLGSLFISDFENTSNHLDWSGLNGIKREQVLLSRLGEIHIDYQHLHHPILSLTIGTDDQVSFSLMQNKLMIQITHKQALLYNVPIIITFVDGTVQLIDNFPYIIDYQVIKESGPLLNVYALN
jgi:hypothetical protein